jgi:fumarate hydratase class II
MRKKGDTMQYRIESDVLGRVRVPKDAYYGSETQRVVDNFKISGEKISWKMIEAYIIIKKAAAISNMKIGKLDKKRGRAIIMACNEVLSGNLSDQFVTDIFQAGAGTNINMNVNEVLANRAIEMLKGKKGDYRIVHPNDHVNMSQSTNDTFPSAIQISCYLASKNSLLPALRKLETALAKKSREFAKTIKVGRTHLQDAVPMTLGQEFSGYCGAISHAIDFLENNYVALLELPLGGTAVGTGLNAGKRYAAEAVKEINRMTGAKFFITDNRFKIMQGQQSILSISDVLKEAAISISKIANDLRLLTSGPRTGISEITLPAILPGSSIMPGKINPSMAEMMNMVCFEVIGLSHANDIAAESAQLELNVFTPIIAYNLLFSINILSNAINALADRCISGIKTNKKIIEQHLSMDLSIATALTPYISYAKAATIVRTAYLKHKSIKEVCLDMKILDKKTLDRLLDPRREVFGK